MPMELKNKDKMAKDEPCFIEHNTSTKRNHIYINEHNYEMRILRWINIIQNECIHRNLAAAPISDKMRESQLK